MGFSRIAQLQERFEQIAQHDMCDMPLSRSGISVETVSFTMMDEHWVGVLIVPWAINLIALPIERKMPLTTVGQKYNRMLGDTSLEFIQAYDEQIGAYEMCPLESPIESCSTQEHARAIAQAVMSQLKSHIEQAPESLSRRGFLTGRRKAG